MKENTLGRIIAQHRRELGLTQQELADQMGVTDKAVSKWERDLSCPDVHSLPHLAEVLQVSLEELMGSQPQLAGKKVSIPAVAATALKAVALAMGIAVAVLSTLGALDTRSGMFMLGLGLAALALRALTDGE